MQAIHSSPRLDVTARRNGLATGWTSPTRRSRTMPLEDESYFRAIPWCRKYLDDPRYVRVGGLTRRSASDTYDTLIAKTLKTPDTIPAVMSFERLQPPPSQQQKHQKQQQQREDGKGTPVAVRETVTLFALGSGVNGHDNTAHGGTVATILDEAAGLMGGRLLPFVTASLHVDYVRPLRTPQVVQVRARAAVTQGRKKTVSLQVCDQHDNVLAMGEGLFVRVKELL
ncbi:acetyltransferase (GNAT) domain-containing protein [Purpureocillium lavendulum]|uniref:Acetyltransferase (GNAT) domain-containing protein n=1 Tax=Purpureocillium lavendulum TaxID=1247861 RepID=A0AB34G4V1_9HYPO|nr:acetyltransferase (GNAT) domain-containing protein [Purpureocillium lavendulum]